MRYLVLSDVHANIDALDAVLADAARHGDLRVLLLGDLVGYGAEPNAVIERLLSLPIAAAVRGNHDRAASGQHDAESFNEVARASAAVTARLLTAASSRVSQQPAGRAHRHQSADRNLPRDALRRRRVHLRRDGRRVRPACRHAAALPVRTHARAIRGPAAG